MQTTAMEVIVGRENALFRAFHGRIPEACSEWNGLQRDKIAALFDLHGTAVIGQYNLYNDACSNLSPDNVFTKYDGEMVLTLARIL